MFQIGVPAAHGRTINKAGLSIVEYRRRRLVVMCEKHSTTIWEELGARRCRLKIKWCHKKNTSLKNELKGTALSS